MRYRVQHRGRSKLHLLDDDFKIICGSAGSFDFDTVFKVGKDENGQLTEYSTLFNNEDDTGIQLFEDEEQYCKKCLKKIR